MKKLRQQKEVVKGKGEEWEIRVGGKRGGEVGRSAEMSEQGMRSGRSWRRNVADNPAEEYEVTARVSAGNL